MHTLEWTYFCPHCSAGLNPGRNIILIGEQGELRTLLAFHPKPGNYKVFSAPDVTVDDGTVWDFSCPVCQANLTTDVSKDLCALDMITGSKPHRLYFSRKAGVHATFVISAEGFLERFGEHVDAHPLDLLELI